MFYFVLPIYRVIQPHDSDEEEPSTDSPAEASIAKSSSTKRVVSKSARAKKLLNKKIRINQHVKFDEDGEPVDQDSTGHKLEYSKEEESSSNSSSSESDGEQALEPVSIDEFEKSKKGVKIGGIEIEKVKELLRSRDQMDRKRERERIRAAHRERRLKSRQMMEGGYDEYREEVAGEGVRLAGASSSEEESEEHRLSEMEEEEQSQTQPQPSVNEEDSELLSSSDEKEVRPKRQKLDRSIESKKRSKRKHKQLGADPEPASLVEDEELALHLLKS